ncbi:MAG: selenide, water dikinase SelD [Candidatus Krumholzibacteriota bacterium]|nr:selenide, water dikinase SelD [Candidatus Krumholzibacteriota bacterium]
MKDCKRKGSSVKAPVYLDFNATTPISSEVAGAMRPFLEENFGNPSSSHWYGLQAKKAVSKARRQLSLLLGCDPGELIFTSGGSESNNLAIKGAASVGKEKGDHIVTSSVEHPAVLEVCRHLEKEGFRVTYLPVDGDGLVSVDDFRDALIPGTILATIMHANNEVGTVQPISALAALARERGVLFHTDAAQSVGKVEVDVNSLGVDMLSVAGHKFYAPKGVGALYIRTGVEISKLIHGADHERNLRAGTENVLEIVGIGQAAESAKENLKENHRHMERMRDRLQSGLKEAFDDMKINGSLQYRLPNTLSVSFPLVEANTLLDEISGEVAASAGAACHTGSVDLSTVLEAMKVPLEIAMGTVRFSTGRTTTPADIDMALGVIIPAVKRLKPDRSGEPAKASRDDAIRLTKYTHGLGCACKLRPQDLEKVLEHMPAPVDENVIVGKERSDDAAVYRIGSDLAIVQSVDFFTPVVDDPFDFGAIAAANSLSDIYAMGARPLFGLNIVAFPSKRLSLDILRRILEGALAKADEAGISIIGGHTIEDNEPKFGLAVTGVIDPKNILSNSTARPGDLMIITKPVGTGVIATAMKRGIARPGTAAKAIEVMSSLNRVASETLSGFNPSACTDITGFGLVGHLREMTVGSGLDAVLWRDSVPVIEGTRELILDGIIPGGTMNNYAYAEGHVDWDESIIEGDRLLLCDAQTSGGLLVALDPGQAVRALDLLASRGIEASITGRFEGEGEGRIRVVDRGPEIGSEI